MRCAGCKNWQRRRAARYADGTVITRWEAPEGQGLCSVLKSYTDLDFGCTKFVAKGNPENDVIVEDKPGVPWQVWEMIPCPDCQGGAEGVGACHNGRCAGTGLVRRYDDGFVGDERTRRHPKELEPSASVDPGTIIAPQPPPSVT